MIAAGPGWVAVGETDSSWSLSDPGDGDAAVWTSVDGITWSRVPHDEAVFGGEGSQRMGAVILGGPGLVAVGSDTIRDDTVGNDEDAVVWTSVDGITWSQLPYDETVFGGKGGGRINNVTATDSGLVAVGSREGGPEFDPEVVAIWTSLDGITWSVVEPFAEVSGTESSTDISD